MNMVRTLLALSLAAFACANPVRAADAPSPVQQTGTTAPAPVRQSGAVKNLSHAVSGTGFVVNTAVTIGYSTPWRQVHAMLEEAARRTADIARDPAPYVRQTALSDFYVVYHLIAYSPIDHPVQRIDILSELHANIQDAFNEHGVQIMSPHYTTETAEAQIVPRERWYAAPAKPPASSGSNAGTKD